jgi:preprotein translocase subunit SecG
MEVVVLTIHLLVCVCLIGLVLLQRSEGGALGMGGGGGGSLMTGRGAADALAKMTSVAGGFFLVTSLSLTVLAGATANRENTIFDFIQNSGETDSPVFAPPADETPVETPAETRPDPTESSIPASTQLASAIMPGPASASASEPPAGATRAAPIDNRNAQSVPSAAQRTAPPPSTTRPATTAPATTQRVNTPATTTPASTQRSNTATTTAQPRANTTQPVRQPSTPALSLPNTSGSTGLVATDPNQTQPESIQVGNGLEAVRRERAGPDQ